jgi:hypothetical protein
MLPNFIVIGAPKCGTTSLCHLLGYHPQVFMSKVKEPHYFGRKDPTKTLFWYEEHFVGAEDKKAIGEGSTSYSHPHIIHQAALDIVKIIPKCRLIYIIRNPVKRLESDWKMRKREGWAHGTINEDVQRQETLIKHGKYWQNICVYREFFHDSQILIIFLEDFSQNPKKEIEKCFKHLCVEPKIEIPNLEKPLNESKQFRKDGLIAKYVRDTPLHYLIKHFMPSNIFYFAKNLLTNKYDIEVKWEQKIKNNVIENLRNDSQKILEYCNKPLNFWNL